MGEVISGAGIELCTLLVGTQRTGAWLVQRAQGRLPGRGGTELGLGGRVGYKEPGEKGWEGPSRQQDSQKRRCRDMKQCVVQGITRVVILEFSGSLHGDAWVIKRCRTELWPEFW